MTKRFLRGMALACGLVFAGPALSEVTFYEREDFRGRSFTVSEPVGNFDRFGFNNRASSAVVRSGRYLICDDAGFRGHCVTLTPGNYRTLKSMGLNNQVSSARPAGGRPGPAPAPGARAVLFDQPNLRGRSFAVEGHQPFRTLAGSGFDNVISSVRVERGAWMFCSGADYAGTCRVFEPGDYPSLGDFNNRISSGRLADRDSDHRDRGQRRDRQGN